MERFAKRNEKPPRVFPKWRSSARTTFSETKKRPRGHSPPPCTSSRGRRFRDFAFVRSSRLIRDTLPTWQGRDFHPPLAKLSLPPSVGELLGSCPAENPWRSYASVPGETSRPCPNPRVNCRKDFVAPAGALDSLDVEWRELRPRLIIAQLQLGEAALSDVRCQVRFVAATVAIIGSISCSLDDASLIMNRIRDTS